MALTDTAIRNAKPDKKPRKLFDGGGLYLLVQPSGSRAWRLKYRFRGREKLLSLGIYPHVTLAQARRKRDEAKARLAEGIDPSAERKAVAEAARQQSEGLFGRVAANWLAFKSQGWSAESRRKAEYVVNTYLLPPLGGLPVSEIASRDVVPVLRKLGARAPDLARKARQYVQSILRYAMRDGLREEGRALVLDDVVPRAANRSHIPAATLPDEAARVMQAIADYPSPVTRAALLVCAYTAQRPGLVASMRWEDIALEVQEWRIPAPIMKTRYAHIVPLPRQVMTLLEDMKLYTGGRSHVFPPLARQTTQHLHRDALSKALREMGFRGQHATHGFRAMFRTLARERLGIDSDILEAQLAHAKRGEVQAAYDRTTFSEARRKAMRQWADWLDEIQVTLVDEGMARWCSI